MNTAKLAAALNTISVAFGELAEALTEQSEPERVERAATPAMTAPAAAPAGAAIPPAPPELSPFENDAYLESEAEAVTWVRPDTLPAEPQGSLEQCPKHHAAYKDGKYGKFCANVTDDEAWGKARDGKLWCRITPKNAAEWLRVTAAA